MKSKTLILIIIPVALVLILGLIAGYLYLTGHKTPAAGTVEETKAIELVKSMFPELKDYPSNNLPPRSIKAEKTSEGWYVAFVQEGSGVPIIGARCFLVTSDSNIIEQTYVPQGSDVFGEFSAKECRVTGNNASPVCALENCHGMDIKCGPNRADVCTEIYMVGDRCLQYAKCGVVNGQCQQIQNSQFTQCKSCVRACIDANESDNMKLFECEGKCK